jgi:hypothetical protein
MTEVTASILTSDDAETRGRGGAPARNAFHHKRRWALWGGAATIVVLGGLWYGLSRASGPTISATVADCSHSFEDSATPPPATSLRPGVVGLGSVASIATFETPSGLRWCFDGMGLATGAITDAQMRSAVGAPVAVVDGSLTSNVLMLVHLAKQTTSVVVTTAESRSKVLAHGGGFEVLLIPMATWPHWHAPWSRDQVALGRIIGFDNPGRVTSSKAFTWCPGSINTSPGAAC